MREGATPLRVRPPQGSVRLSQGVGIMNKMLI
jgi:hypothetical protein